MPDTDTLQWIGLGALAVYMFVLTVLTARLGSVAAGYAKDNRELWETHLGHKEETD